MLVNYLNDELKRRKVRNSKYSLRSFAKSLDMDPSTLSALLKEKRPISKKYHTHIMSQLGLTDDLFSKTKTKDLHMDEFSAIADWEYFTCLALLKSSKRPMSLANIALSLGSNSGDLLPQLERLKKLNFVKEQNGKWSILIQNIQTKNKVSNEALKESHRQHIYKALKSVDEQTYDQRDLTGVTLAFPVSRMEEARQKIFEFRKQFCEEFETESQDDEIYRLNLQLFNLTESPRRDK